MASEMERDTCGGEDFGKRADVEHQGFLTVNAPVSRLPKSAPDDGCKGTRGKGKHRVGDVEHKCETCGEVFNFRHDLKFVCCPSLCLSSKATKLLTACRQHRLKEHKRYVCPHLPCPRDGRPFGTINDLHRHEKARHGINREVGSFRCAARRCRNQRKLWTRADNFKQHIRRMHPDEDWVELKKR